MKKRDAPDEDPSEKRRRNTEIAKMLGVSGKPSAIGSRAGRFGRGSYACPGQASRYFTLCP